METRAAIGIDFGGTTIKSAIVENGKITQRGATIDTRAGDSSNALIEAIIAEIVRLKATRETLSALGIGLPGVTDSVHGIVHELSNVPGWRDVPLRDLLRERTGLHTAIENDANAMAYAEWKYGAASGERGGNNVVCVTLGTGVGGGLILNGQLFRGSYFGAGEIGQMSVQLDGVPGNYGNSGALEKYVGNAQITERARVLYAESGRQFSPEECSPAVLAELATKGDAVARKLWDRIGVEIGAALANIVWLLNPDSIVIGGGVAKAGDLLFDPIRHTIRERTMPIFYANLHIVPAMLGNDAGIIGSAAIALDSLV
jgi:glucokinase